MRQKEAGEWERKSEREREEKGRAERQNRCMSELEPVQRLISGNSHNKLNMSTIKNLAAEKTKFTLKTRPCCM